MNTCGHSKITTVAREYHSYPISTLLMYYADSVLESSTTECNLNIISPSVYAVQEGHYTLMYFDGKPHNMSISVVRGFAVYLTQQKFNVTVNITVTPTCKPPYYSYITNTALILFVNSVTDSLVTFRGYPFDFCMNDARMPQCNGTITLTALEVLFYETPSFNTSLEGITSPLLIKDTSFLMILHGVPWPIDYKSVAVLLISKLTPKISHEIVMENVSWCNNEIEDLLVTALYTYSLFLAQAVHASNMKGNLILKLHNIFMLKNKKIFQYQTPNGLIKFINVVNVTMTGTNYFAQNIGGSVIILQSSNLTVSGNITINDGYSFYGGGIRLDTTSTLFLKEPLSASFSSNNAVRGSAIFAPVNSFYGVSVYNNNRETSPIQISPIENYSVENVTDINIKLYFSNNTFNSAGYSIHASLFSFFGNQTSPNFLFDKNTWDDEHSQYVYTTLIDTIIQEMDTFDKYSSLSNGICFQPNRQDWNCIYIDYFFFRSQLSPVIYAYPGGTALSIVNVPKGTYNIEGLHSITYYDLALSDDSTLSYTFYCDYKYDCDSILTATIAEISLYSWPIIRIFIEVCPFGFNLTGNSCSCLSVLETHVILTLYSLTVQQDTGQV